jgi:hypothetical protein
MKLPRLGHRLLVQVFLALVLAGVASGQQPANVSLSFTVMALGDQPINDLFYLTTGGKLTPFKAPSYQRSAAYQYVGPTTMMLYHMVQKDGAQQPEQVAQAKLPTGTAKVLVLLVPAGTGYTMGAVDDGAATLPLGKVRVYNATPNPLMVAGYMTDPIPLKPFETATMDPKDGAIMLTVSALKEGQWQPIFNSVYRVPADQKIHLFLMNSYTKAIFQGEVQVFHFTEGNLPPARTFKPVQRGAAGAAGAAGTGGAAGSSKASAPGN